MLFLRGDGKTFQIDLMDGISTDDYIATDTSPDIMFRNAVDPFVTFALLHHVRERFELIVSLARCFSNEGWILHTSYISYNMRLH